MAEILTRTYTYTGKSSWTAGESSVSLSSFTRSGSTRPITKLLSISASWYRYQNTSSTVTHTAELVVSGATYTSSAQSYRGDGKIFKIETNFVEMPSIWSESSITFKTKLSTKLSSVYWRATSAQPMVVTITYLSSEFKPSISDAKLYRASSTGAASDSGTYLTFTAKLAVEKTGTSGSGTFRIYSGYSAGAATTQVYSKTGISGSTSGVTVSAAAFTTLASGSKKWFRMEFSYTATANGVSSTETVSAAFLIGNVFTNVHLAGVSTGGVRFGGYSTAAEGSAKFECDYPAYLYGGIAQIGDGNQAAYNGLGIQTGIVLTSSIDSGTISSPEITFEKAYKEAPTVIVSLRTDTGDYALARCSASVLSTSTSGFKAILANYSGKTLNLGMSWAAFGTLA